MIGNKIAKLRKERGITQQELADAIHVERTTLSKIENGVFNPSAETMQLISNFFNLPLGEIFFNPDVQNYNTKEAEN